MTFSKTWIWLSALAVLASCAPAIDDGCAGWRTIRIAEPTLEHLAQSDPQTLAALIAHHEFGQRRGCWR